MNMRAIHKSPVKMILLISAIILGPAVSAQTKKASDPIAKVEVLINQYVACKREVAGTRPQVYRHQENCRLQYQPKFARACVGAARDMNICQKLYREGSIEVRSYEDKMRIENR